MITESNFSENEENKPQQEHPNNDQAISENTPETSDVAHDEVEHTTDARSVGELVDEMEKLINQPNAGAESKAFNHLKNLVKNKVADEKEVKKHEFEAEHETDESFSWEHPLANKISGILHIFHEKHQEHLKHQEELHQKHREERHEII